VKLTVLGRYGPFPAPGGACSSYLLEGNSPDGKERTRLVMDLGAGTLSRLVSVCPIRSVDAILLSHLHSDHMSDLLVLRYALQQLKARGVDVPTPLTVVAPPHPELEFRMLASAGTFDMVAAHDGMRMKFGPLTVTLHRMQHPVPTFAMEIEEELPEKPPQYGEEPIRKRLIYTGDTGLHERLPGICTKAAALLADTGFLAADKTTEAAPHLTAREAGYLAKEAGVGRLLCTHIWGGGYTDEQVLAEAREGFPGAEVVQEMKSYEI